MTLFRRQKVKYKDEVYYVKELYVRTIANKFVIYAELFEKIDFLCPCICIPLSEIFHVKEKLYNLPEGTSFLIEGKRCTKLREQDKYMDSQLLTFSCADVEVIVIN